MLGTVIHGPRDVRAQDLPEPFVLTSNDAANLEAAMLIHELNPTARIVMRINNSRIARRLDSVLQEVLGDSLRVIDPFEHVAPQFVEAIGTAYDAVTAGTSPSPRHAAP